MIEAIIGLFRYPYQSDTLGYSGKLNPYAFVFHPLKAI